MGTKIKDAQLLESVTGVERIPVSDGSGNPKAVTTEALKNFVGASGGGGIPIVDSEDKLETLDLPQGSLASVAYDNIEKVSFRDLYQPTMNDLDQNTGLLVNPDALSKVDKLEFTFPEGLQSGEAVAIYFIPKTFGMNNQKILMIGIEPNNGAGISVLGMAMLSGYSAYTFCQYDDNGVPSINQENIDAFNELLTTDDWCYFGYLDSGFVITEAQFDLLDKLVKSVSGVSGTDLYIKEPNGWIKEGLSNIPNKVSQLEDDLGIIFRKDAFLNYIENDSDATEYTLKPTPNTLVNFKGSVQYVNFQIDTPPAPLTKFGLYGNFNLKTDNVITWITAQPDGFGLYMIIITYCSDNTYIGECYEYTGGCTRMQYEVDDDVFTLFNGSTNHIARIVHNNEPIPITNSYKRDSSTNKPDFCFFLNEIKDGMFEGTDLLEASLSVNVGNAAFKDCKKLYMFTFAQFGNSEKIEVADAFEGTNPKTVHVYRHGSLSKVSFTSERNPFYYGIEYLYLNGVGSLTYINIEEEFDSIGSYSYAHCNLIQSVTLPKSIKEIDTGAFYGCTNVSLVKCNAFLSCENKNIFKGCTSLRTVEVANVEWLVGNLDLSNNIETLIVHDISTGSNVDFSALFPNLKSLTIDTSTGNIAIEKLPATLESLKIGKGAKDVVVTMPSNNVELTFDIESKLQSVEIKNVRPKVLKTSDIFNWVECFKNIPLSGDMEIHFYKNDKNPFNNTPYEMFKENLNIPIGIGYINDYLTPRNNYLRRVTIPETMHSIGVQAFYDCENLREIINKSIYISCFFNNSFSGKYIETITGEFSSEDNRFIHKDGTMYLFAGYGLSEYIIPDNINNLECDISSETIQKLYINKPITLNGNLSSLKALKEVHIPSIDIWFNVKLLSSYYSGRRFFSSTNSASLYVNGEILKQVEVNTIKSTDAGLFCYVHGLEKVVFSNVTLIPESYLEGCADLVEVVVGNSVEKIRDKAFSNCTNLSKIDFTQHESIPILGTNAFSYATKIVVPDNLYDQWIVAEKWSNYASQIVKASEYVEPTE